jgi:peptidoglycan/LPS O-acetylase OafA/YrhL
MVINKSNNFDVIRLIASLTVIISHSYEILGLGRGDFLSRYTNGNILLSDLGIWTFFIISGFLIDKSVLRSNDFFDYFWKRIIRIFPGLLAVVLITTFLLGPLVTELSFKQYFTDTKLYNYLFNFTLLRIYYSLPGVFTDNIYSNIVNGSLWTLQYEYILYFIVAAQFFIKSNVLKKAYSLFLVIIFIIILLNNYDLAIPVVWMGLNQLAFLGLLFYIGVVINKYNLSLAIQKARLLIITFIFIIGIFLLPKSIFAFVCLPLFIFKIAFIPVRFQNLFNKYGDFSYGIYICISRATNSCTFFQIRFAFIYYLFYGHCYNTWSAVLVPR